MGFNSSVELLEPGIVKVYLNSSDARVDIDEAKGILDEVRKMIGDEFGGLLIHIGADGVKFDVDAAQYLFRSNGTDVFYFPAMVGEDTLASRVAMKYVFSTSNIATRAFSTESAAIDWLKHEIKPS